MTRWLQAIRQTTIYLGVVMIAIVWGGIYLLASQQHERAYEDAVRQGSNLTRVLEEYIRRVVQETDHALLALRRAYQKDPQHFDIADWIARTQSQNNLAIQFGITGADGFVKLSSLKAIASQPPYVGDRAHFTFQRDATSDQLYISEPVVGHVSGKLTIQFTRRLSKPDGSFDGSVVSSLDIAQLEDFFSSLDIGDGGVVSLVGTDGVVRAHGGRATPGYAGISVINSPLFRVFERASSGSYWNSAASSARFDGVKRLISYRAVAGLPLIAVVGLTEESIFQQADATLQKYVLAGTVITVIVLIVMAVGVGRQARILSAARELQRSKQSIEQTNILLQTALKNMAQGLCMFDREQRLVMCNDRYGEMYGLGPEQIRPGTSLRAILEARVAAGISLQDGEQYVRTRLEEVETGRAYHGVNELTDGSTYAVSHRPMAGGGWVATHDDITEQRRAEQDLD